MTKTFRFKALAFATAAVLAIGGASLSGAALSQPRGMPMRGGDMGMTARPAADMQAVLDQLQRLGVRNVSDLDVERARTQPTLADAVMMVMRQRGMPTAPDPAVTVEDVMYPGPGGQLPARIYRPANARGPLPVVVYYHGGGWVIANLDVYDSTPRAMAQAANVIVVSAEYRHGPEARFPAFEDDAVAAWRWAAQNARGWGGDPDRMAVAGESAGGNLAVNVAIAARDSRGPQPLGVLAVYPIANADPNLPSKRENTAAQPLRTSDLMWFGRYALRSPRDMQDPRFNLIAADLRDLPPVTIVRAQIDPLRSDGETLEEALRAAGNDVDGRTFDGVTHEFFGMGKVVRAAYEANQYAVARLQAALTGGGDDRGRDRPRRGRR